ncbi:MAG: hypothetical protein BEN18_06875 [Epulopiscium sp. Nuni2H_MBin001]|nr:MAG: hypothetical protein BEN18_06875 [Epulopiscium sp. Nuni2H_MBin001]
MPPIVLPFKLPKPNNAKQPINTSFNKLIKTPTQDPFYTSVADLMTGVMIVFLLIAISFMMQIDLQAEEAQDTVTHIQDIVDTYEDTRTSINIDLNIAFEDKLDEWDMVISEDNTISFNSPDVLFELGKSDISPEFKKILDEFFPAYIELVYGLHKDTIQEIRIEGHTSSDWSATSTVFDAYFNNMELSQNRTREVLKYVMGMSAGEEYIDWLMEFVTANGLSSSKLIYDPITGLEDKEKSRRVEFKIVTDSEAIINQIMEESLNSEE